jgi:hypothetical protein
MAWGVNVSEAGLHVSEACRTDCTASTRHAEHLAHALSPADCSCKPGSRTAGQGRTVLQAQGWSGRFECGRAAIAAQRWVLSAQGRPRMGAHR